MKPRPNTVNILGVRYTVEYVDKPSEVDIFKRDSLWGQIDYWTRSIRIYCNVRSDEDVWQTLIHEVLHGIGSALHLDKLAGSDIDEDFTDTLALALTDVMFRNSWIEVTK